MRVKSPRVSDAYLNGMVRAEGEYLGNLITCYGATEAEAQAKLHETIEDEKVKHENSFRANRPYKDAQLEWNGGSMGARK
jgi:hypothetical protein